MDQPSVKIDTYHEYMTEAILALRLGINSLLDATGDGHDDHHRHFVYVEANMQCRFAFLLAANAVESAANALILGSGVSRELYRDIEKIGTILKFEIFCMSKGKTLDRGNVLYAKMRDVVRCRNEFVHPKPRNAEALIIPDKPGVEFAIKKTKTMKYPEYFSMFEPKHSVQAIGDILSFLSWVVFDVCQYGLDDGALVLGLGERGSSSNVCWLAHEYDFDVRTFGEPHC